MKTKTKNQRAFVKRWMRTKKILGLLLKISLVVVLLLLAIKLGRSCYRAFINPRLCWADEYVSETLTSRAFTQGRVRLYHKDQQKYKSKYIRWVSGISNDTTLGVFATLDNKRGYFDTKSGEVVIPAEYEYAWAFSEGLAGVVKDGKIGFIDANNQVVIPFIFDSPEPENLRDYVFHGGYCVINDLEGKCGIIDREGHWVLAQTYLDIKRHACLDACWTLVDANGNKGLMDAQLNWIRPAEYDDIEILAYPEYINLVKDGRKWREDIAGNVLIDFMFDYSHSLYYPTALDEESEIVYELSDYHVYGVNYHCGILNRKTGKVITPAIYEDVSMISESLFELQCGYTNMNKCIIDLEGNIVD